LGRRVDFEIKDKVAFLTFNRPEKRNAIDDIAVAELKEYFDRAGSDENIRAIVFEGEGSAFSAGADLEYLQKLSGFSAAANLDDSSALKDFLLDVYRSRKLTCAVVRGPAIAGAFGLVLACDIVIASEKAKFGFTEVKIGFVPAIVLNFALRKLRESDVRELVLTGKILDASAALRVGLFSQIVPDNEIAPFTAQFLKDFIAGTSAKAVSLTKEILAEVREMRLDEALKYATTMNVAARATDDFQKGIKSFLNKERLEWQ
jgi:methylglutaconyl-CoA hydratase